MLEKNAGGMMDEMEEAELRAIALKEAPKWVKACRAGSNFNDLLRLEHVFIEKRVTFAEAGTTEEELRSWLTFYAQELCRKLHLFSQIPAAEGLAVEMEDVLLCQNYCSHITAKTLNETPDKIFSLLRPWAVKRAREAYDMLREPLSEKRYLKFATRLLLEVNHYGLLPSELGGTDEQFARFRQDIENDDPEFFPVRPLHLT